MAEYSRIATGSVISTGGQTLVVLPFTPTYIRTSNKTRAVAGAGVTSASWYYNDGQGSAYLSTFGTGEQYIAPLGGTSSGALVSGTGFTTVKAGLALQYSGAAGVTSITKNAGAPVVTTTAAHGLVTGNVVIFQNLYQTTTTGMQQIAGMPFVVTVTGATTFTINWDNSGSNYTAISAAGLNAGATFKKSLYPVLYAPGVAFISGITNGTTTTVTTTIPHNFVVGQEVAFRIPTVPGVSPTAWGPIELNSLPNVNIPGSPVYGYVVAVTNRNTFVVNINSTGYTAFNPNIPFLSFPGENWPQVVAVGDVNTGGWPLTADSALYPSPRIFNGFTSSTTVGTPTIGGPAIQGSFINATFQGFIIGTGIAGTAADVIDYVAVLSDINV